MKRIKGLIIGSLSVLIVTAILLAASPEQKGASNGAPFAELLEKINSLTNSQAQMQRKIDTLENQLARLPLLGAEKRKNLGLFSCKVLRNKDRNFQKRL